jgi:gas vesicle protein
MKGNGFIAGVAAGMLAGATISVMVGYKSNRKVREQIKSTAQRTMRAVGEAMDNITN